MLPYDETDPQDIENYAKRLIGKTFYDILREYFKDNELELEKTLNKNKGKLGNLIEEYYFYYKPNSNPNPDFLKANTELKVTPYIKNKNGELKAKERLVIGMIPNDNPIETDFEKSHVLEKLQLILLILYFHDKNKDKLDYSIDFVKLFSILGESCKKDLEIIKKDYQIIVDKIISGNAHKLSEGDTNYLGACTKGSTAKKSLRKQYYGKILAKRRAFSLKQSYMSYVLNTYIVGNISTYDSIVKEDEAEHFEDVVLKKIYENTGLTIEELCKKYNIENKPKHVNSILIYRMLGVKSENAEEFEKANFYLLYLKKMRQMNINLQELSFGICQ